MDEAADATSEPASDAWGADQVESATPVQEIIHHERPSLLEVEATLRRHPAVLDVSAFGVPHLTQGVAVGAAVVLRSGHVTTPHELSHFGHESLPAPWLPDTLLIKIITGTSRPVRIDLAEWLGWPMLPIESTSWGRRHLLSVRRFPRSNCASPLAANPSAGLNSCREHLQQLACDHLASRTPVSMTLSEIVRKIAELAQACIGSEAVSIDTPLMEAGMRSLTIPAFIQVFAIAIQPLPIHHPS